MKNSSVEQSGVLARPITSRSVVQIHPLLYKMTGPGEGKKRIKNVVYIHEKGKSNASVTHIDIEGDIGKIIKPGETTFVKGKPGGVFIALKKEMIKRAEKLLK